MTLYISGLEKVMVKFGSRMKIIRIFHKRILAKAYRFQACWASTMPFGTALIRLFVFGKAEE